MAVHDTRPDPTLPADHAFVVQLRKGTALTTKALTGEVEHIVSGQSCEFRSFGELVSFIEQMLTAQKGDSS
ncbi:MAG: hypothetical protein AB7P69_25300 [Candidatus Binatia bacterium]